MGLHHSQSFNVTVLVCVQASSAGMEMVWTHAHDRLAQAVEEGSAQFGAEAFPWGEVSWGWGDWKPGERGGWVRVELKG